LPVQRKPISRIPSAPFLLSSAAFSFFIRHSTLTKMNRFDMTMAPPPRQHCLLVEPDRSVGPPPDARRVHAVHQVIGDVAPGDGPVRNFRILNDKKKTPGGVGGSRPGFWCILFSR